MDIKRVAVIGPECTGKSDLSQFLADEFKTVWVQEYAREYLDNLARPYDADDLPIIARGQIEQENIREREANRVLICDTNLYVVKVWSNFKYGYCDPWILQQIATRKYDLYLLTYIDIPWQYDPLREHPDQREGLYSIYLEEMKNQSVPFVEIKGNRATRQEDAKRSVMELLAN
jgi:NadR type nicotinamide-nucleotide adenylyltransferase